MSEPLWAGHGSARVVERLASKDPDDLDRLLGHSEIDRVGATNAAPVPRSDVLDFWELFVVFSDILKATFEFLKVRFCGSQTEPLSSKFDDSDEVLLSKVRKPDFTVPEAGGAALLPSRFRVAFFR